MTTPAREPLEQTETEKRQKRREWRLFLFIVVLLFPLLSIALVGAYGFAFWMFQLLAGHH